MIICSIGLGKDYVAKNYPNWINLAEIEDCISTTKLVKIIERYSYLDYHILLSDDMRIRKEMKTRGIDYLYIIKEGRVMLDHPEIYLPNEKVVSLAPNQYLKDFIVGL